MAAFTAAAAAEAVAPAGALAAVRPCPPQHIEVSASRRHCSASPPCGPGKVPGVDPSTLNPKP